MQDTNNANHAEPNQWALLAQKRFAPFFWTQFFGAANDNVFKFCFTLLVTFQASTLTDLSPSLVVNMIAGLFILPFILFSATSGQLADKYDKATLMRVVKILEIAIMLVGAWGFIASNLVALLSATFLMGLHSTLFGPVKYAYLPQVLGEHEMVGGNGMVEMGTFIAILLGTMAGGFIMGAGEKGAGNNSAHYAAFAVLLLAVIGCGFSFFIPKGNPADASLRINWNPFTETWRNLKLANENKVVFRSLLGISWLWFFGATFLTQFAGFAKNTLGGNEGVVTLLLAVFSIGIGMGSVLCERLSGRIVEIGLVPLGSIGMTVFGVDLYFASRAYAIDASAVQTVVQFLSQGASWRIVFDLFMLSAFSGLYSVPLYALIQTRCQPTHRSRIIGANNILNALFMITSAALAIVCLGVLKLSIPELFLITAILNALVAIYIYTLVPEFLLRFVALMVAKFMYRLRTENTQILPATGSAVLVCNHVSFIDAIILFGVCPRPIRFVMDSRIYNTFGMRWMFRQLKAIPIAPASEDPAMKAAALEAVHEALQDGELVCLFPEGGITKDGDVAVFKNGIRTILARDPVPVYPAALQGLWGSFFSRKDGSAMSTPFKRGVFSRVGFVVGEPIAPELAMPEYLRERVVALRGDQA